MPKGGYPKVTFEHFKMQKEGIDVGSLKNKEVLIEHFVLTVDPYAVAFLMGPDNVGSTVVAGGISKVIASNAPEKISGLGRDSSVTVTQVSIFNLNFNRDVLTVFGTQNSRVRVRRESVRDLVMMDVTSGRRPRSARCRKWIHREATRTFCIITKDKGG